MQLLKTKVGMEALDSLDVATISYLEVFKLGSRSPQLCFEQELSNHEWDLDGNDKLWKANSQSYSSWICNLAYALLIRTTTPHLRVCQQMVMGKLYLIGCTLPYFHLPPACPFLPHCESQRFIFFHTLLAFFFWCCNQKETALTYAHSRSFWISTLASVILAQSTCKDECRKF